MVQDPSGRDGARLGVDGEGPITVVLSSCRIKRLLDQRRSLTAPFLAFPVNLEFIGRPRTQRGRGHTASVDLGQRWAPKGAGGNARLTIVFTERMFKTGRINSQTLYMKACLYYGGLTFRADFITLADKKS